MTKRAPTNKQPEKKPRAKRSGTADHDESLRRDIERKAYQRYCDRGCVAGFDVDDWLAAEHRVLAAHPIGPKRRSAGRGGRTTS